MLRTDFTRSLFTLLDITWALSTAVCTSWSSIDLLRTEFIGDFLKLQSFKAMKKVHREHLCQYCTSSSCPFRPRTFIKNEHLSRAFLRTLGNVGLTGEYVWPLELKKQSHSSNLMQQGASNLLCCFVDGLLYIFRRDWRTHPCQQTQNQTQLNKTTRRPSHWVAKIGF